MNLKAMKVVERFGTLDLVCGTCKQTIDVVTPKTQGAVGVFYDARTHASDCYIAQQNALRDLEDEG